MPRSMSGRSASATTADGEPLVLVEANLGEGVVGAPLSKYCRYHTRICRPIGLTADDCARVCTYAAERIGFDYDVKNIFDLLRYLFPLPVPQRWRRRMMALGSGHPTRIICSALIAQAFEHVRYPILPKITRVESEAARHEILEIRHSSLYAPRDFDISPYFAAGEADHRERLRLPQPCAGPTCRIRTSRDRHRRAGDAAERRRAAAMSAQAPHQPLPLAGLAQLANARHYLCRDCAEEADVRRRLQGADPDVLAAVPAGAAQVDRPCAGDDRAVRHRPAPRCSPGWRRAARPGPRPRRLVPHTAWQHPALDPVDRGRRSASSPARCS